MIVKKLIEKIEGEAELDFHFKQGKIDDVQIKFGFYRGIEEILVGKSPRDALVITPRVCGICNHAHLIAAVRALEDGYQKAGLRFSLSTKALKIREFTLACELMQNHIKWFYLTILPKLTLLTYGIKQENYLLKASYFSSLVTKALAIFAGQWPHSSYAIAGGVTCDPTYVDVMQAIQLVDEAIRFFERELVVGVGLGEYLQDGYIMEENRLSGDLINAMQMIEKNSMSRHGQSHDRFIALGDSLLCRAGKSKATIVSRIDIAQVKESIQPQTTAKAVTYKEKMYEAGPLARAMIAKNSAVKQLHKRYKDSLTTRIFARVHEVALLLQASKTLLHNLELSEPSCVLASVKIPTFEGIGIVEAARGSLIHKTTVKAGKISRYEIITPTQWNLSGGNPQERGVAVEGMVGLATVEEAELVFRSFDVCSVCTTQ